MNTFNTEEFMKVLVYQMENPTKSISKTETYPLDIHTTVVSQVLDVYFLRSSEQIEEGFYTILKIKNISYNQVQFKIHLEIGQDTTFEKSICLDPKNTISIPTNARWDKDDFNGSFIVLE